MKKTIYILIILIIVSCSDRKKDCYDWQKPYFEQEHSRRQTIKTYFHYNKTNFTLESKESTFETFNSNGIKISSNNRHFFKYDSSGKLILEEYCMRTCEKPGRIKYYYDNLNRLYKTTFSNDSKNETNKEIFIYNDKNLIIKKIIGNDIFSKIETYTYDNLKRIKCKKTKEYNSNVKEWLTYIDSMFYNRFNQLVLHKRQELGSSLIQLKKYEYRDNLLITEIDTAIGCHITPKTIYSANINKTEFKYDSTGKILEKISYQPDYKTPYFKVKFEYR